MKIIRGRKQSWVVKRITINLAKGEVSTLDEYCEKKGVGQTDIIRRLIRSLEVRED